MFWPAAEPGLSRLLGPAALLLCYLWKLSHKQGCQVAGSYPDTRLTQASVSLDIGIWRQVRLQSAPGTGSPGRYSWKSRNN